jgi:hypothetical protein
MLVLLDATVAFGREPRVELGEEADGFRLLSGPAAGVQERELPQNGDAWILSVGSIFSLALQPLSLSFELPRLAAGA